MDDEDDRVPDEAGGGTTKRIQVPRAVVDGHRRDAAHAAGFRTIVAADLLRRIQRPGEPTR